MPTSAQGVIAFYAAARLGKVDFAALRGGDVAPAPPRHTHGLRRRKMTRTQ
jgi:hypothetical protein